MYDTELKRKWDKRSITETARREGREEGEKKGLVKGRKEGEKKGLVKGRKEGRKEGQKEIISHMIEESKFDDDSIARLTRVPVERVQEIRAELKKKNARSRGS